MSVEEVEKLRKRALWTILIGAAASIALGVVGVILEFVYLIVAAFVGVAVTAILGHFSRKKFILAFKGSFVLKSLEGVFTDLDYRPQEGLSRDVIASTKMMDMGDRYTSNDFVSAKYKNVNFVQADVHIEERHVRHDSNGTHVEWVTLFKGRWMEFDFNKEFKANIQIRQKGFGNAKISNWGKKRDEKFKKVALEDLEFNKQFKVFAQSEHDAFYVLTPAMMERIKKLTSGIKGKVLLCLVDDKLHIGLQNNKDSFEHSVFKKVVEAEVIEKISKDIKMITSFVDELNLDNDLFRKVA